MLTAGIMDALDIGKAHIVGHDWGSALAWVFAALYPERTLQLVAMSVGNPNGYFKGDHANEQKKKSWYADRCLAPVSHAHHRSASTSTQSHKQPSGFCCKPAS